MHRIELGYRCNNACVFCGQGRLRELDPPPVDQLEAEVDELPPGRGVAFVGGEPTLSESLPRLIARARARGARPVLVQTNGRRLAVAGYAASLVAAGLDGLEVSLHGANAAMHDYHTGVEDSFRQTVAGLRRASAERLRFVTTTVVTRSNFRHLTEIVRVAHALGARAARFDVVVESGNAARNAPRVVPAWPMLRPHLARAVELAHSLALECVAPALGVDATSAADWYAGPGVFEPVAAETPPGEVHVTLPLRRRALGALHGPIQGRSH